MTAALAVPSALQDLRDVPLADMAAHTVDQAVQRVLPGGQPVPVAAFSSSI